MYSIEHTNSMELVIIPWTVARILLKKYHAHIGKGSNGNSFVAGTNECVRVYNSQLEQFCMHLMQFLLANSIGF